jgi:hypothetical protein
MVLRKVYFVPSWFKGFTTKTPRHKESRPGRTIQSNHEKTRMDANVPIRAIRVIRGKTVPTVRRLFYRPQR